MDELMKEIRPTTLVARGGEIQTGRNIVRPQAF